MKLPHRNAIITGASQGLGETIARRFIEEGASVLICARDQNLLTKVQNELKRFRVQPSQQEVYAHPCDVSNEAEVEKLFSYADQIFGGQLQILVNNAGVYGPKGPSEEVEFSEWKKCLEINLYGTFLPCRAAIKRFKKLNYGKIINLSGGGATNPMPNISGYASSKAAVVRLTETLAEELRQFHVDVNAIAPGALNTRLLDELLEAGPGKVGLDFYEKSVKQLKDGGVPLDLGANLSVYLACAQSDGVTGKLISAKWDPWHSLHERHSELVASDIYTLRRIVPEDRGQTWELVNS